MLQRQFVGRFQTRARRQTARDTRERYGFVFQKINKIVRGRFAFDIDRECENNFGEFFFFDSFQQLFNPQILRTDVIQRRNASA